MPNAVLVAGLLLQLAQNPSPMVDSTRAHQRLAEREIPGIRSGRALHIGQPRAKDPVLIHFHGAGWIAEQAVATAWKRATVLTIQAGSGSRVYQEAMADRAAFQALLEEAQAGGRPVFLSSFSAGYGAIRAILGHSYDRIQGILLLDSLHAGYLENAVDPAGNENFLRFASDAAAGRKRMLVTHSEVFPGTFASTTETADWLLDRLAIRRKAVLRWGPLGMQQLSETRRGRFLLLGFAGNSAPDHVDHLHGMSTWLKRLHR